MPDLLPELAVLRLAGCFEYPPVDVVVPAMVTATNADLFHDTVFERRVAVAAVQMQQTPAT